MNNIPLAITKLQEIDDLDRHGRYGRLAREALEALKPEPIPWDVFWNRHYEPVEKRAAEIYASFQYNGRGSKPDWTPHGNGTKQDDARDIARKELRAKGHVPSVPNGDRGSAAT